MHTEYVQTERRICAHTNGYILRCNLLLDVLNPTQEKKIISKWTRCTLCDFAECIFVCKRQWRLWWCIPFHGKSSRWKRRKRMGKALLHHISLGLHWIDVQWPSPWRNMDSQWRSGPEKINFLGIWKYGSRSALHRSLSIHALNWYKYWKPSPQRECTSNASAGNTKWNNNSHCA